MTGRRLASLADELRRPVEAITAEADSLLAADGGAGNPTEAVRTILEAAALLSGLVDELATALEREVPGVHSPAVAEARLRLVSGGPATSGERLRRILIVDDDAAIRDLLRLTLPAEAFQVVEARDGADALAQIGAHVPDLVVLDWNMPERTGGDVLDALQQSHAGVPVIVLTAETRPTQRALANALGAQVYLTKPFSPLEFLGAVERLLLEDRDGG